MPSGLPSVSPSAVPSARPSVSPSASPTISMQPSSAPSLERVVSAKFFVQLPIETGPLNTTQIQDLQNATSSYVEDDVPVSRGRVMQVFVKITDQSVVHVSNTTTATTAAVANTTTRRLAIWSELNLAQALQLNLTISGLYFGSDKNFDLHKALAAKFQQAPNSLWFARLAAADGVFASLAPAPAPTGANPNGVAATSSAPDSSNNGLSKSTVAVVSLLAVAALALGVGASVYSIRHYKRRSMYGQELSSPRLSITASSLGSRIANENLEYHTKQLALESTTPTLFARPKIEEEKEEVQEEEVKVEEIRAVNSTESSWNGQMLPLSPNSLEKGGIVPLDQIMQNKPRLKEPPKPNWSHVPFSISNNNRAKDPPSADSEINFPSQRRTDQQQHTDSRHISSLADNNVSLKWFFFFCALLNRISYAAYASLPCTS